MKKLRHKNIIQFIEVYEDNNNLMMIMEYCPGKELFDVILENKSIPEQIAKGIFSQIARAVYYLHCLNILHRDIKPENILIMTEKDKNNQLVAKLLDFGLSKNANAGSLAKTFVGTPCYLAPEVEFTSKGLGGTYGLPADCWSLGAVLYVMLVARFPEFEQDPVTHKVVVKLNPDLWGNISEDAKTLIRSLMNTNPKARLTASGALQHPWLESYAATPDELSKVALSTYNLSHGLQEEEIIFSREQRRRNGSDVDDAVADFNAWGAAVDDSVQAVVVRPTRVLVPEDNALESLRIAPLLHLQRYSLCKTTASFLTFLLFCRSIATCFEEAHSAYSEFPEVATQVRKGATLCRDQLTASMKMLRNVF